MKREVVGRGILILFLFIFVLSGVFASAPVVGTCGITARSECTGTGNHIVMGLSSATNAHGEFPDTGLYGYVLCCALGEGDTTCTSSPKSNEIISLSSATNAHAQIPSLSSYSTKVCYEDLECKEYTTSCPTDYPLGILSLTSTTNAHIGGLNDYNIKVCCSLPAYLRCELTSAQWNRESAAYFSGVGGETVHLEVVGSGAECAGMKVNFKVYENDLITDTPAQVNPVSVNIYSDGTTWKWMSEWSAEWLEDGLAEGNPEYYFNATLDRIIPISILSANQLTVTEAQEEDPCANINSCEDYTVKEQCESDGEQRESDERLCNVAKDNSIPDVVDCSEDESLCLCLWDDDEGTCGFAYTEITDCGNPTSGEGCNYGCTLCYNTTSSANYCTVGDECPTGENPTDNNNGTCDWGEGCLSPNDCFDGDLDTCADGLFCSSGMCYSFEEDILNEPINLPLCKITQSIEKDCNTEPVGSKIIIWTGEWLGEGECGTTCEKCKAGGRSTVSCAAQVQLPFFDYAELIVSIVAIAAIYISMIFKKKFFKKKSEKKKK